ncbi:serine hydrolase domain-containing protein [Streptomyces sp. NPDC097619]|uniref:serine hydrolase domain-containing protein n=1 Tax=Streptomyces sp. NPDC097619 TaxID=3157228 RepID=UPI00332DC92F
MSTSVTDTRHDRPELRRVMRGFIEAGVTGVQLRVDDRRGEWTGSAGLAELGGTAAPPVDGLIRIGSTTKTFTAVLVLQLVAEGRIGLDDPVADHLSSFGLDRRITVRMLLGHTSGIFNFTGEYYEDGTIVPGIVWQGREWVEGRFTARPPEELVRLALSKAPRFEPGADWSYSNTNYVLARLLVEEVTGRPSGEELRRRIVDPLGLTGTFQPGDPARPGTLSDLPGPHAHAYYRYEEGGVTETVDVTRQDPSWISGGGDLVSTTRDLHLFVSALVGGRLLPAPLLAAMYEAHPKAGYGLGIMVQRTEDGATVLTHNGGAAGHAALMYSTPDGATTLTAGLNYVDDAGLSLAGPFARAARELLETVFGNAGGTGPAAG